jgi:hypothetical protein
LLQFTFRFSFGSSPLLTVSMRGFKGAVAHLKRRILVTCSFDYVSLLIATNE